MNSLNIINLSASYGRKEVLCDINLTLQQGEFVCLCGPNGAGKSTLLSVISGVPEAGLKVCGDIRWERQTASGVGEETALRASGIFESSKQISVNSISLRALSRRSAARLIAYMQQNEYSEWDFTVRDYVLQGRYAYTKGSIFGAGPGNYAAADYEVVDGVLGELGLADFSNRHIHSLSGGEFQKVRLARALAQTPCFLLLDEPAANLDYVYEPHLMQLLSATAHTKNLGVLAAVHDINLAARFADKIILLPPATAYQQNTASQTSTSDSPGTSKKSVLSGAPSVIINTDNLKYTFGVDFECREIKSFQSLQ